jgi:hypothetical protein
MKIIADILGILGILITVFVYQQKKRETMLWTKLILDVVWMLHYCFIGAYSGAVVAVIAAVREIVFVKRDPKKASGIIWLPIFIVVAIVSTILTWKNIFSIFTLLASCIAVVSFFIGKPKLSRILAFPVSMCMLTYDIACNSVAGIVNESFAIISSAIGIIRLDRKTAKKEKIEAEDK